MREVSARYKGALLGGLWTFLMPLLMIALYGFVFGRLLGSKWTLPGGEAAPFALILFGGMVFVNVFTECLSRAPGLLMENPSYIKKVVFPLEIMPYVALTTSSFTGITSLAVLAGFYVFKLGLPPATVIWLPVVVAPLFLLTLGVMWFLGSLGVYLRDIRQVIGFVVTGMIFLTPQFYPLSHFPSWIRPLVWLNPLTLILEQIRGVMFWGYGPDWPKLGLYTLIAWAIAWGGLVAYAKVHRGFADVL